MPVMALFGALILAALGVLSAGTLPAAAKAPPPNVRPTMPPPDEGRQRVASPTPAMVGATAAPAAPEVVRLPSTTTADYGRSDRSMTIDAFTAVTLNVTLVPGCVELGGVSPVTVIRYVSAGHVGPR